MSDKEIRADAKLKNLPAEALEELWLMRNPGEDGEKLTLEAIAVEVPLRFGFTCSVSSLSEFYKWLRLKKRMEGAQARAIQARLELARDPSMTPEDLDRAAQTIFTAETLEEGNVKGYVALAKLGLQRRALDHDARKLALLEEKAAEAKAKIMALTTAAKSQGGLTPETLAEIEEAAGLL
jgi:hypothetical protein